MTRDWTNIESALVQIIEQIDEHNWHVSRDCVLESRFELNRIEIVPDGESLRVTGYDESGRAFKYSAYLNRSEVIIDG